MWSSRGTFLIKPGAMGFSILHVSRSRINSMPNLQSTSLGSFWPENLYALRNTLVNGFRSKLQGFNGSESSQGGVRTWTFRPITTRTDQRAIGTEIIKPSNLKHEFLTETLAERTSKLALNCSKSIQFCDAQQTNQENPDIKHLVKVFVIDVETTGFCRQNGRIIEIAIRDLSGGKNSCFQTLVNPEQDVPNSHIHGITTHMVNQPDVPRMEDLIPILMQYIRSRQIPWGHVFFVSHNGRCFDVPFLINEFGRCSVEIPSNWLFIDTIPLARELMKLNGSKLSSTGSKLSSRISLHALREYYGIPLESSKHRAMSDVNILSSIFGKMTVDLKLTVADLLERSFKASDLINLKKIKKKKKS